MSDKKKFYIKKLVDFVKKNKCFPTRSNLRIVGMNKDAMRNHFGNMEKMKVEILPLVSEYIFDISSAKKSKRSKSKRFIITSAATNSPLNTKFFNSVKGYCKKNNAELLIIPIQGVSTQWTLDKQLETESFVISDLKLNSNVTILGIKATANKVDPTTGLPRIGQRNGTFIIGSSKQRLKYVANGLDKLPHALMSPGSITLPNYYTSEELINQSAYIAQQDHVCGAIILELDKSDSYHFRQIQSAKDGSFIDMGVEYKGDTTRKVAPAALVLGDWHADKTSPVARKAWEDVTKQLNIKTWIMHDVFDGYSITHHDAHKKITRAKKADGGKLSLERELSVLSRDLKDITKLVNKVVIVKSNHDEHLERYLDEGRFLDDAFNFTIGTELANVMAKGLNPLKYVVEKSFKSSKIKWLERDEDYSIAGIQCGAHGDKGANGSRGSINALENAYGNVIFGHAHTPQILRGAWCVGTSTEPFADYGSGPSSWVMTSCIVYPNGQRQMINVINGKYRL